MKRIVFLIVLLAVCLFYSPFAYGQEVTPESSPSASPTMSPTPTPEYVLPYPGLLPDSPLYFLKAFRDRLIGFLIADPLKKAEFNVLQADKRLTAAVELVNRENFPLAESTISKGENYFAEAIQQTKEAQSQGFDTTSIIKKMNGSLEKHEMLLAEFSQKATGTEKDGFLASLKRVKAYQEQVATLTSK
jgi:hypothetical protein